MSGSRQRTFRGVLVGSGLVALSMVGFLMWTLRQRATERVVVQAEDRRRMAALAEGVLRQLLTDEGLQAVLAQEPPLVPPNRKAAFQETVVAWRGRFQALLNQGVATAPLRIQFRQRSGGMDRVVVDWPDHARMDLIWRDGRVASISLGIH